MVLRPPPSVAAASPLVTALGTLDFAGPSVIPNVVARLQAALGADAVVLACPVEKLTGWALARFTCSGAVDEARFEKLAAGWLARANRRLGWFDGVTPEPHVRNLVIDLTHQLPATAYLASTIVRDVLEPMQLDDSNLARVVLTDRNQLVGWLGVFQRTAFQPSALELVAAIVPALVTRLVVERQLADAPLQTTVIDALLAQLAVPAFVIGPGGRLRAASAAGRELLESRPDDVRFSLDSAIAGRAATLPFEIIALRSTEYLAVLNPRSTSAPERSEPTGYRPRRGPAER